MNDKIQKVYKFMHLHNAYTIEIIKYTTTTCFMLSNYGYLNYNKEKLI